MKSQDKLSDAGARVTCVAIRVAAARFSVSIDLFGLSLRFEPEEVGQCSFSNLIVDWSRLTERSPRLF